MAKSLEQKVRLAELEEQRKEKQKQEKLLDNAAFLLRQ